MELCEVREAGVLRVSAGLPSPSPYISGWLLASVVSWYLRALSAPPVVSQDTNLDTSMLKLF